MRHNTQQRGPIVLDCSRISSQRSGLGRFANLSYEALISGGYSVETVGHQSALSFPVTHSIPNKLLMKASVSIFKPIHWLFYARFKFPVSKNTRMLSVMQNTISRTQEQVVTVHDLRPMYMPDNFLQGLYWRYVLPITLKKTKAILTVSETSKQKICSDLKIPASKVYVVHSAFEPKEMPNLPAQKQPKLLCVGCNWKHKNIHELIKLHKYWAQKYELDIVAANTPYIMELKKLTADLDLTARIHFHSDVSDSVLEDMYKHASALVYPSMDEGFGVPPLEAMTFRTPVITSNIPVFKEILGSAPIFVELGNDESWKAAFQTLETPLEVEKHVNLGIKTASNYPRSRTIEEMNEALLRIWPDHSA